MWEVCKPVTMALSSGFLGTVGYLSREKPPRGSLFPAVSARSPDSALGASG